MNKDWILFQLREAQEELDRTIRAIEISAAPDDVEFQIALAHMYNHLNTAWNSRNLENAQTSQSSEEDFYKWRAFPTDIQMGA